MRPLLPKEFLRKFPKRSVLAGVQRKCAVLAKRPAFVATVVSIGIHGGLALSIPRLLPSSAQEDTAVAIETDVVTLSPTDLAAFSSIATAPAPRSSNQRYTDLNGQTLPNLSALRDRDKTSGSLDSGTSSFGWGSASSYYDWSDRGTSGSDRGSDRGMSGSDSGSDSDGSSTDATREDEFYEYWQRSQELLDRFDQGGQTMNGGRRGDGGDAGDAGSGGNSDDRKAIAGNNTNGGEGNGGNTAGTGGEPGGNTGAGSDSGAPYTIGMAARQRYADWAIAVQDENSLSDAELTPIFIPVSIPVPVTASSSGLIGERGTAGLLVKPDGTPASADILSSFSSLELAKSLVREFVISGFSGCNVGILSDTWTACGLDITFIAANGSTGATTANGGNAGNSGNAGNAGNSGNAGNAGNSGNPGNTANASGDDTSGNTANATATPPELLAVIEDLEPDAPIAIAINETAPAYREWRDQLASSLGNAAEGLAFRSVTNALPYPPDLDPEFDRSLPTTAIVSLALNPDLTVVSDTATVLRSSGSDQLDAIALGFAENTPRDWYATNLELDGEQESRGTIVLFTLSFVEAEDDTNTPLETNPGGLGRESDPNTQNTTPDSMTRDDTTSESDPGDAE